MVGSVLLQRMQAERDFDHIESQFFSTSNVGGKGPSIGKSTPALLAANDLVALKSQDAVVTCQGGDYTNEVYPRLRAAGWNGYWIDAASALRMADDAVIILDPVNRDVIDAALARGVKNYIGGNCTVSLMLMALAGLFRHDLVEWMTCMTYQAASGAGAQNMRELLQQMGEAHLAAKPLLDDPDSAILDIDREVAGILRDERFPDRAFRRSARGQPDSLDRQGSRQRQEPRGVEGRRRNQQDPRPLRTSRSRSTICVRIGAMRCHTQALTIKLRRDLPLAEIEAIVAGGNDWVRVVPNTREASLRDLTPAAVTGRLEVPVGRLRKLAMGGEYVGAFTVGDQLLWGAAEPLRRMLRILLRR